ncbi:hypothetical protein T11_1455 [Trichinella zimbabwensis]|uniref:Uncharacterized protein n=1 Tax=Trichinella zimbabwensis TaxID=268475 RepID=A0A0V1HR38_9BILA|nr:hypothetical protein T11_1455 [Trichinella zimbabwensis]
MIPSHANAFHLPVRTSIRCHNSIFIDLEEATQVIETTDHLLNNGIPLALAFLSVHLESLGVEILNVGTSGQVGAWFDYFWREWLPASPIRLCHMRVSEGEKYVIRGAAYTVQEQQVAWLTSKVEAGSRNVEDFLSAVPYLTLDSIDL